MNDDSKHLALVRWGLAAILACIGYLISLVYDLPLFSYYPMEGAWHWQVPANADDLGPRIAFFGWKAAGLVAGALAWLVPARLLAQLPAALGVAGVALITTGMLIYESRWFLM